MKLKTQLTTMITGGLLIFSCQHSVQNVGETRELTVMEKMLARADSLELDTPYEVPLGDTLSLHAAGFAKILCSAVFMRSVPSYRPGTGS